MLHAGRLVLRGRRDAGVKKIVSPIRYESRNINGSIILFLAALGSLFSILAKCQDAAPDKKSVEFANDASHLNRNAVAEIWNIPADRAAAEAATHAAKDAKAKFHPNQGK